MSSALEIAAASKLNMPARVPPTAATVTLWYPTSSGSLPPAHATDELEVQDAVVHRACSSREDAVWSKRPNCSPVTVTEPPPLRGTFCSTVETTGPSKLSMVE